MPIMSEIKQVKVDNWGAFFLQRLKNFFNRTDYCDLTLQFQDNVQLKVHRLVLNACTEYFEILERTCEMYEDCLIMPDDLQTDVMLPIINFMYTGQLDYKEEVLEKLYQTSQIMNISVLSKLLDAQRGEIRKKSGPSNLGKRSYNKISESAHSRQSSSPPVKRSFFKPTGPSGPTKDLEPYYIDPLKLKKRNAVFEKRPTRYEVPPELEGAIYDDSFTDISYDSRPLMVHPETRRYERKNSYCGIFSEASTSKRFDELNSMNGPSTSMDFVECKRIEKYDEDLEDESNMPYDSHDSASLQQNINKDKLFDQMLEDQPKVTIETKGSQNTEKIDHAKIICEVLKKYPHLVKTNKNIRLKILPPKSASKVKPSSEVIERKPIIKKEVEYIEMNKKEAEEIIKLGVNNVNGPWLCMLCGAPGRYLHHKSYYEMRRHLVEVHQEKPYSNLCEYCGLKCMKRNYLLHHMYTKHGIQPPPSYQFPKCSKCNYIALTNGYLAKHKLTHFESKFRCNVCMNSFQSSTLLLNHIQTTGHKISADRKQNFQCIYCMKQFLRENNLYTHLKICHKTEATADGIIDYSDEEDNTLKKKKVMKQEVTDEPTDDVEYEIQEDGNIKIFSKSNYNVKQKILNEEFVPNKIIKNQSLNKSLYVGINQDKPTHSHNENIKILSNKEFIPKNKKQYTLSSISDPLEIESVTNSNENNIIKNSGNISQSIQIVVSNEEEYKALLGSNSSIIFNNCAQGKTLTVLGPSTHTSLQEPTTIDMENSQSNDMVILQNEYPINVSEAVPTDSGNIMVLYDPTDNGQNKYIMNAEYAQPELLVTQDMSAQYAQTSTVLTQSYQTIATTTSMVDGQVLVQQPIMSWPTNEHQEIISEQHSFTIATPNTSMVDVSNIDKEVMENNDITANNEKSDNTLIVIPTNTIEHVENVATEIIPVTNSTITLGQEEVISNNETMEISQNNEKEPINNIEPINSLDIQNKIILEWQEMTECESTVQIETSNGDSTVCPDVESPKTNPIQITEEEEGYKSADSDTEAIHNNGKDNDYPNEEIVLQSQAETEMPVINNIKAKEKINSLLTDWDENDSQTEEVSLLEKPEEAVESQQKEPESHLETVQTPIIITNNETILQTDLNKICEDKTIDPHLEIEKTLESMHRDHKEAENEVAMSVEDTTIEDATIEDRNIEDATIEDTNIEDATIEDTNVEDTNIEDATIEGTTIENATMEETNTTNINQNPDIKKLVSDWDEDEE